MGRGNFDLAGYLGCAPVAIAGRVNRGRHLGCPGPETNLAIGKFQSRKGSRFAVGFSITKLQIPNYPIHYNPCMLGIAVTGAAAAAAAAATVAASYQSMAPTGQWYGRTFTGLSPGARQIALTYDDGPNDPH